MAKYNPDTVAAITQALTELKGRVKACEVAGISYDTFWRWMKDKSDFSEAVKRAEAQARDKGKEVAIMSIFSAMEDGKWQAGAWWLERKFKDEFSQRTEHELPNFTPPKIQWADDDTKGNSEEIQGD